MNRMIRFISIIVPFIVMISSCATMQTKKGTESFSALLDNQPYQMRVRSGHSIMDRIIYETASIEFGKFLSISETDSYRGTIEIIFVGISESSFLDATTDFTTSSVVGSAWYTKSGYIELRGSDPTLETGSTSGTTVMPEDITMRINIKGSQEERLWTADYKHKGGMKRSFATADSEEKAAKRCITRIVKQLKDDFQ